MLIITCWRPHVWHLCAYVKPPSLRRASAALKRTRPETYRDEWAEPDVLVEAQADVRERVARLTGSLAGSLASSGAGPAAVATGMGVAQRVA